MIGVTLIFLSFHFEMYVLNAHFIPQHTQCDFTSADGVSEGHTPTAS